MAGSRDGEPGDERLSLRSWLARGLRRSWPAAAVAAGIIGRG